MVKFRSESGLLLHLLLAVVTMIFLLFMASRSVEPSKGLEDKIGNWKRVSNRVRRSLDIRDRYDLLFIVFSSDFSFASKDQNIGRRCLGLKSFG